MFYIATNLRRQRVSVFKPLYLIFSQKIVQGGGIHSKVRSCPSGQMLNLVTEIILLVLR